MSAAAALQTTGGGDAPGDRGRQMDLLSLESGEARAVDGPRGPGRPPGARNKRTEELLDWLQRNGHKAPLEVVSDLWRDVCAAAADGTLWEMADKFGMKREDLVKMAYSGVLASLNFWHPKLSPDVVVNTGPMPTFIFGVQADDDPAADAEAAGAVALDLDQSEFTEGAENG